MNPTIDLLLSHRSIRKFEGRVIPEDEYDESSQAYYKTRTGGNKDSSWSEEMRGLVGKESRPHTKPYLAAQGFALK